MKIPDTVKQMFIGIVAPALICLGGCMLANSSKKVATQKNLATQLVETSEIHIVFAQSYVYGFSDTALSQGQPKKEVDCIVNQITPELMLPLLADVFDKKVSDDELRQAIKFYESETGKTYIRNEKMKARLILGISTEEPPAYSLSDEDRIVAFEQTLVGKLVTSQDNSLRESVKETIRPKLFAIIDQCKKSQQEGVFVKSSELLIVALVYVAGVTLGYLILSSFQPQNIEFSLCLGAFLGSETGAVIYHRRESATAPFSVKASVGLLMALLCVIQGLLFQALWGWLRYPEISLSVGAVGTFIGPFLFYGTMQKAMVKAKAKQAK